MFIHPLLGRAVLGTALVLCLAGCGDDDEKEPLSCEELSSRLQDALTKVVADESLAGATAAVRLPDCTWRGAAGDARKEPATGLVPEDRLRAGSIAKTFVAVVVLQLQAEGRLSLDAPLSTWVPDFPRADRITVRQLLNNTSGVADYTANEDFVARAMAEPSKVWAAEELVAYGASMAPLFEPGAGWSYSNSNFILAGLIIEKVTGTPAVQQLRERIIEPVGLRSTGMDGLEPLLPLTVRGYAFQDGAWADLTEVVHPSAAGVAGALVSTADDLNRFFLALFEGGLLPEAQLTEMRGWVSTEAGKAPSYGLGLLQANSPYGPLQGHDGGIPGFSALAGYYPEHHAAVSVLTNHEDGDTNAVTLRLLDVLRKR